MKTSNLFLLFFLGLSISSISQDKTHFNPEILDMGEAEILRSTLINADEFISQEFTIKVPSTDHYYIAAWIIGNFTNEDKLLEYRFVVNEKEEQIVRLDKNGPQAINILDEVFDLTEGINTISIKTIKPYCPNVEFIKVSTDKQNCQISDKKYKDYIENISKLKLDDNYDVIKNESIEEEQSGKELKSLVLDNPSGNYDHEMDVDFSYSFSTYIWLDQWQTYTIETKNATSDPVLHVFYLDYPAGFSRTDDDSGTGYNAKLTFNAPYAGYYRVFVRKNSVSVDGTCDIFFSGQMGGYYLDEVPIGYQLAVSGTEILCPKTVSETLNWFTADLTGDSRIWIMNSASPGKMVAENDDWTEVSDFNWGNASRIRSNLNTSIKGVIVSCGSYSPTGSCDLYMNCKNSNISTLYIPNSNIKWFPNLKATDAIQSAQASGDYNCIGWSGGMTTNAWPISLGSDYCYEMVLVGPHGEITYYCDTIASFNLFYSSERYDGATLYTLTSDSINSVIDLWYNSTDAVYTHASVRKPGNNHPHGYDWESKPGAFQRTFHPRHSLNNESHEGYGHVKEHYIPIEEQKKTLMRLEESIARGLSTIESVELNTEELKVLKESFKTISSLQQNELQLKYNLWKETWIIPEIAIHSNPIKYASSKEYDDFLSYCKLIGEDAWLFLFDKFNDGDFYTIVPIEELVVQDHIDLLHEVKDENSLKKYDDSGAKIVRSLETNVMKFIKRFLESEFNTKSISEDLHYSNEIEFTIYPNPTNIHSQLSFELITEAFVLAYLINLNGKIISELIPTQKLSAGLYNYSFQLPSELSGTYLVKLAFDDNENVKVLIVE